MTGANDSKRRERQLIEAMELHERADDRRGLALDCYQLGVIQQDGGRLESAERLFRRALVLCEALQDVRGAAAAHARLGLLYEIYGDRGQARFFLEEARRMHEAVDDRDRPGE